MFEKERQTMVEYQLKKRGITNDRVLTAMNVVPRHIFIPEVSRVMAYGDFAVPIGQAQTISQPYIVAKMLELLDPQFEDKILEVGSGSGYVVALLSKLCTKVIGVERIPTLVTESRAKLKELKITNAGIVEGDGSLGVIHYQPFSKIIVSAACPEIPEDLVTQLKMNGTLIIPIGDRMKQKIIKATKTPKGLKLDECGDCSFVPLMGQAGFK